MKLTTILVTLGLATAALANPVELEARNDWKDAKKCNNYECKKYEPKCDKDWYPKYCGKGWGDKSCGDYCESCLTVLMLW